MEPNDNLGYIAYDCTLYQPACVLVAASMGAKSEFAHMFPAELWLLAPTPDMHLYPVKDLAFLKRLIELTLLKHGKVEGTV